MSIEEIIQRLRTAMDDAREHESHFESWLIQNEGICDAIDALKEIDKSQRQWVGLTDEDDLDWEGGNLKDLIKAIEAKLKEKNT